MTPPTTCPKSVRVSLFSYGHANGSIVHQASQARYHKILAYNIRHLPNPPRHLRANATGLSRRLQKEFLQNENVEAFLAKVQSELLSAVKTGCDHLLHSTEQDEREPGKIDDSIHLGKEVALEDPDVDIVVTICCEEGRHRSVAFVEELTRRLTMLKHGDCIPRHWQLSVNVTHRDIGISKDLEQSSSQQNRPSKALANSRQRARREKGDRIRSCLGDDDG